MMQQYLTVRLSLYLRCSEIQCQMTCFMCLDIQADITTGERAVSFNLESICRLALELHVGLPLSGHDMSRVTFHELLHCDGGCPCDVQQMTEAAVAKERAKLYAELKQSVSDHLMAANADELTSLKDK